MPSDHIIVIGASAGGLDAVRKVVAPLPADLPAAVCVVLHMAPWGRSVLPNILNRAVRLPVSQPEDREAIEDGRVYVARPDHHLLVEEGRFYLWHGPRENLHRPAINTTLRTAAASYGSRATGVVLTGAGDDGTAGLWWIKRHGGTAIVQDPEEAAFPAMPTSAIAHVTVDHIARLAEITSLLATPRDGASPGRLPGRSEHE